MVVVVDGETRRSGRVIHRKWLMKKGSYKQDDGLKRGNKERLGKQQKNRVLGSSKTQLPTSQTSQKKAKKVKRKRKEKWAEDLSRECEDRTYNDSLAMDLIFFAFAHVENRTLGVVVTSWVICYLTIVS